MRIYTSAVTCCYRDPQVRDNVKRMFGIWRERLVYETEFIDDLIDIIGKKTKATKRLVLMDFKIRVS